MAKKESIWNQPLSVVISTLVNKAKSKGGNAQPNKGKTTIVSTKSTSNKTTGSLTTYSVGTVSKNKAKVINYPAASYKPEYVLQFNTIGKKFISFTRVSRGVCDTRINGGLSFCYKDGEITDKELLSSTISKLMEGVEVKAVDLVFSSPDATITYYGIPSVNPMQASQLYKKEVLSTLDDENETYYLSSRKQTKSVMYRALGVPTDLLTSIREVLKKKGIEVKGVVLPGNYTSPVINTPASGVYAYLYRDSSLITVIVYEKGKALQENFFNSNVASNFLIDISVFISSMEDKYGKITKYYLKDESGYLQKSFKSLEMGFEEILS